MNTLTGRVKAYVAGIMDGEGYIGLTREAKAGRNPSYHVETCVTNTSVELVSWLKRKTGIGRVRPGHAATKQRKESYVWDLAAFEIKPFLLEIMDDLVVKRTQAELLIEYIDGINKSRNPLTTDEAIVKDLIWRELRELNKKGSNEPST